MRISYLWKSGILSLFLLGSVSLIAHSQQRTVTGQVTAPDIGPMPGVNIVVQGTVVGAVTDVDGNYSIQVPGPDAVLVFSSVGYSTQAITVGDRTVINLDLEQDVTALDEIVVIGYGTQRKQELTSAITNVKSEEFVKGNVNNPAQLIQGKVAGLSVIKPGGNPNQGYTLRLRGLSTIGQNTEPLVVIDGVIGGSLDNVDPNDIETIDVLKDGSAAAIYGTRGSSGVIIVTTKKGRRGTSQVDYNGYVAAEMVGKFPDVMTPSEWRDLHNEVNLGTDFGESTDWFREITRNALSHTHNLALSGGSETTTYRASINVRNAQGVAINTGFDQLNGRLNMRHHALNDRLTVDLNVGATQREAQYGFDQAFRYATIYNPTAPVRSDDPLHEVYDGYFQQELFDFYNPVQILEQNINDGKDRRLNLAGKVALEIVEGLTVDAFYSIETESLLRGQYYDKNSYYIGTGRNGLADRRIDDHFNRLFESTARWTGAIGAANLTLLGGYSYQEFFSEGFHANGGDFITDAFTYNNLSAALDFDQGFGTVESYKNSYKMIAFFSRVNLNVGDNWFLMASARYEGSSRFGDDREWGLFPAVGGGVELASFLDVSAMDNLKLRVSYGITGNQPSESYISLLRFGRLGNFYYNGEFIPGYAPVSNPNPDLGWERKGEIDVGVDYSFFNGTFYGSLDFYTRTTTDLLFLYEVPTPPNLYRDAWVNIGEIRNSGIELSLTWRAVEAGDFSYTMSITPTYYLENQLVSLSGTFNDEALNYGSQSLGGMGSPGMSDVPLIRAEEGQPIGQLWAQRFVEIDPDGNLILEDTNEDGTVDALDRQVVGNGLPDAEFGFSNNFSYGNFDLNLTFRSVLGHDLNNTYRAFYEVPRIVGSYNVPSTTTNLKNPETGTYLNNSSGVLSSYHIEDASFISLDNASLGYNFDMGSGSGVRNIRVYLSGNNLFFITGYQGVDPNPRYADRGSDGTDSPNPLIPGIDRRNTWFRTRSVSLGLNLGF